MTTVKRFVTVGAAVAAPALVAVVAMSGASTAQQMKPVNDVNVVNPVESPVPVAAQGTTQVGGTVDIGNLPATQQVGGTVNIGNLPATQQVAGQVGIAGPVTVRSEHVAEPFHTTLTQFGNSSYVVPEGKQLRIRTLSGEVWVPGDADARLALVIRIASGSFHRVYLPLSDPKAAPTNRRMYEGALPVDIVVPAGSLSGIHVSGDAYTALTITDAQSAQITVLGQLEDARAS